MLITTFIFTRVSMLGNRYFSTSPTLYADNSPKNTLASLKAKASRLETEIENKSREASILGGKVQEQIEHLDRTTMSFANKENAENNLNQQSKDTIASASTKLDMLDDKIGERYEQDCDVEGTYVPRESSDEQNVIAETERLNDRLYMHNYIVATKVETIVEPLLKDDAISDSKKETLKTDHLEPAQQCKELATKLRHEEGKLVEAQIELYNTKHEIDNLKEKGSILDDYADLSTEMPDYMGGDD